MATLQKKRVTLNVGGELFETFEDTLSRYPQTLLGKKDKLKLYYSSQTNQYFFDRNRICFEAILYFYQSNGSLNCPPAVHIQQLEAECQYFQMPQEIINRRTYNKPAI